MKKPTYQNVVKALLYARASLEECVTCQSDIQQFDEDVESILKTGGTDWGRAIDWLLSSSREKKDVQPEKRVDGQERNK